ncbi:MAG: GGDEF domain-containing phosphodiesterase, partial [Dehalococcoidia bacterium]|nr:GGDEF domain-containing phosphodiesterase [Dehalococcoidia bacterium]
GAREAAERMMNAIRAIVVAPGDEVHLTASAGISLGPLHSESGEQLIRYAVNAMYDAKNAGRDRMHVFDPASEGVSRARLELEAALRGALDREEFEVFYQPQVDLRSGAIHAAEALVRWRHPEQGLIGPDVFIGLMEEVGLIGRLGEFVLRRACVDARDWADLTPAPVRVSVNLSPGQFLDDSLVDLVRETLAASGLPAELLELEITESTAMVNGRQALRMIEALRAEGVRVAIDDFGTGHSSLQRLNEFPVNVLKVDRSFVKALETDSRRALPVLKGIVALGQALGLEIVAEGIETEMQAFVLAGVRCDLGQGFLFSAAMPNEEMRAQLAAGVIRAGVRVA